MWIVSTRVRNDERRVLGDDIHHRLGRPDHNRAMCRRSSHRPPPDTGARRSSRGDLVDQRPGASRAASISRNSRVAQFGDRLLARLGGQPHLLDLELGDLAAVLGQRGFDLARRALQPCQLALRRQEPGHLGQGPCPSASSARRSRAGSGSTCAWVDAASASRTLVLLGDLLLLLIELRGLLALELEARAETAAPARRSDPRSWDHSRRGRAARGRS